METVAATPSNFADHIAAQDTGGGGEDTSAVPDRPVQIQDPAPAAPANDNAADPAEEPTEPIEEQPSEADEFEQLRALKTELEGDALPESLRNKTHPVKINGLVYDVPITELAEGYQRNADYSRKLREVTQMRDQAQATQAGAQRLLQDLNNPQSLLAASKQLGFYKALVEAAREIGKQRLQLMQLPPEAQQYALQLEEERASREAHERRAQQLEEQMRRSQQQQPSEDQQRIRHQLDQLVPRAFAKHKVGDYPLARDLFTSNLQNLYEGGDLTAAVVDSAAQATAEQLADIAQRLPKAQPANGNGQPLSPRRAAPANGKPLQRKQSGTPTDFRAHLDRLNGER